ncbi:unnamed protein product, partial [Mesorhabditis spiculigera]
MVKQVGRVTKTKTHKGKRVLEDRAPKVVENDKTALFFRGMKTSNVVTDLMHDLHALKKPLAVQMKRRNQYYPFDDETPFEIFADKYDASLFFFGANSKKHPNSVTFGRMHDGHLLDMVGLKVVDYKPLSEFNVDKISVGAKPCIILEGTDWEEPSMRRIGNLLVDWLRGPSPAKIRLQGLEHVISLTCIGTKILLRVYRTQLKKSDSSTPRVELVEMGPRADFEVDRKKLASDALFKDACRIPQQLRAKARKNTSQDVFGSTLARVHIGKQNTDEIQLRKVKALKKMPKGQEAADGRNEESGDDGDDDDVEEMEE